MPEETLLLLSEQFVISCGCVLFVPASQQIVLVKSLSATQAGSWLLPKGRKNVGETLEAAAVREAFEETGCECELWECEMRTRATDANVLGRVSDVARSTRCTEPLAVQMRATRHGHQKLIFWFIGKMKEGCTPQPLEAHEHYEVGFFGYDEAVRQLRWDHDREIVRKAVQIVRGQPQPSALQNGLAKPVPNSKIL
ncbi:hypothetical protein CALCODRAFT_488257 [Calocera cornea HHB12733]|uniref:Nudix hydrolase domain-containing protein n=1 Tax=Calocera cornea HHB12733 TaxID=1353952 RepID=A0A165CLR0_9BASI|nr:hypothetical protein CALCODRAFT_488257 [Calocera cornea HHB12733]